MQFLQPIWLWALTGLLIPVAIHLLSRKEGKTIYIGSIRHLVESKTARFSSLKLNEVLLLLLRMVFLTLIVFLLSQVVLETGSREERRWLVVEPGMESDARLSSQINSLVANGFEKRILMKGFPTSVDSTQESNNSYWSLVNQLRKIPADSVIIMTYGEVTHFKGKLTPLPAHFQWLVIDRNELTLPVQVVSIQDKGFVVTTLYTNDHETSFSKEITRTVPAGLTSTKQDSLDIAIFYDRRSQHDKTILTASLNAIATELFIPVNIKTYPSENIDGKQAHFTFWLSDKELPFKRSPEHTLIVFRECLERESLLIHVSDAKGFCSNLPQADYLLTRHPTQDESLRSNLTVRLAAMLTAHLPINKKVLPDYRVMPTTQQWSPASASSGINLQERTDIAAYIAALAVLVLFAERWISFKRNQ